jgi:hypothetical protein
MLIPSSMRNWLRLPSRIALLFGLGALSVAGANADTGEGHSGFDPARVPQHSVKTFGDLLVWSEGGRIYTAEAGREVQELALGDTPEAHRLRQLLERDHANVESPRALRDRIILVGGGGDGFHWAPPRQVNGRNKTNSSATRAAGKPADSGLTMPVGRAGMAEKPGVTSGDTKK